MPSKNGSESSVCLEKDGNIPFDPGTNAGILKDFYSNLASNLVKQLPTATSKYGMDYVRNYYKNIDLHVHEKQIINILEKFDTNKAAGIDGLSGFSLKMVPKYCPNPLLISLISLSTEPESYEVAKLNPLFKKGSNLEPKSADLYPSFP